jgi:hypothetical protein
MHRARKVIDWHGQGVDELAGEFATLPRGRYLLIPEGEGELSAEATDEDLSSDEIEAINEGIDAAERGEVHDWADVKAELNALLATSPVDRPR